MRNGYLLTCTGKRQHQTRQRRKFVIRTIDTRRGNAPEDERVVEGRELVEGADPGSVCTVRQLLSGWIMACYTTGLHCAVCKRCDLTVSAHLCQRRATISWRR